MDSPEPTDAMRRVLWPIKNEAAAVIAEMRQNAKWAASRSAVRTTAFNAMLLCIHYIYVEITCVLS